MARAYTRLRLNPVYKGGPTAGNFDDLKSFNNQLFKGKYTYTVTITSKSGITLYTKGRPTSTIEKKGVFDANGYSDEIPMEIEYKEISEVNGTLKAYWRVFLDGKLQWEEYARTWFSNKESTKSIRQDWSCANIKLANTFSQMTSSNGLVNQQEVNFSTGIPARVHIFVIVEEVGKDGFLTRKIYTNPNDPYLSKLKLSPEQINMEVHPERYGLAPRFPDSKVGIDRHVMGMNNSKYISATEGLKPSARMSGRNIYIDVGKAQDAGVKVVSTEEILSALEKYKAKYPHLESKVNDIAAKVRGIDKEVLLYGNKIPASAIFNERSLAITKNVVRGARVIQVVGIAFAAYDVGTAAKKSYELKSARPITAEAVRQIGGWAAAVEGASIGAGIGAAATVETGPGAVIGGIVGGIIFGTAGYFGADWVADFIYKN